MKSMVERIENVVKVISTGREVAGEHEDKQTGFLGWRMKA